METIGVIDYGMGNLHSLAKSLERVAGNQRIFVSYDTKALLECDRLVLPGVGGVRACMDELRRLELDQMVIEAARKRPLLGICLGMQVLLERSDENGGVNALGLIPGSVVRFPDPPPETEPGLHHERLKVPHMGWNQVRQTRPTRYGPACRRTAGSTSCTATTPRRKTRRTPSAPRTIRSRSPRRWRATISSASNSTRKRARTWG